MYLRTLYRQTQSLGQLGILDCTFFKGFKCGNNESINLVVVGSGKPLVLSIPRILELSEKVAASYRCLPKAAEFKIYCITKPLGSFGLGGKKNM